MISHDELEFFLDRMWDLDQDIMRHSESSEIAPPEFLENELRRDLNRVLIRFPKMRIEDRDFTSWIDALEDEYLCYYRTEESIAKTRTTFWWKNTYAGCNAQIESFLAEEGLADALEKLGVADRDNFNPVKEIANDELPERIRKYLIAIGYLYPDPVGEKVIVHPNLIFGQRTRAKCGGDCPFLTRDIIRSPYHHLDRSGDETPILSDEELWQYWKDLVTFAYGDPPEHKLYPPKMMKHPEKRDEIIDYYLSLGRKFVPNRYLEFTPGLVPSIERFDWVIPSRPPKQRGWF